MTSSSATTREKPSELRRKFLKCEAVGIYGSSVRYLKAFFEYETYVCETVGTSRAVEKRREENSFHKLLKAKTT